MQKLMIFAALSAVAACDSAQITSAENETAVNADAASAPAATDISLPAGFRATVFHEGVGANARHIAVRDNGDVFVARRDGEVVVLRDTDDDGVADDEARRELPVTTGVQIYDGYLYVSDRGTVSRVALDDNPAPQGEVETVVDGFIADRQHGDKTFAISGAGDLYVNVGVPSNACMQQMRTPGSPGQDPCPLLERFGGVWKYDADRLGQDQMADGERLITGARNIVALDWSDREGALLTAQHGRDQLSQFFPEIFDEEDNAEMPAEEFHIVREFSDFGWPYTFYDPRTNRRLVAPEYGGDGEMEAEAGRYKEPDYAFPAHWAPNDILVYTGDQFPEQYRRGAFIAFHGSWNRAPLEQAGYRVVFTPIDNGEVSGEPTDFATGFPGRESFTSPRDAARRPMGLAQGPDGALYISDSVGGRIWKVTYVGE